MAAAEQIAPGYFAVTFPVLRTDGDETGEIIIEGIASDEGLDLENEIVKASGWLSGLEYLKKHGKVNWDHDKENHIGDVEDARIVAPEWVRQKFGFTPAGKAVYVRLKLYKPNSEMPPEQVEKLRKARGMVLAGAKLGLSMEGLRAESAVEKVAGIPVLHTSRAVPVGVALTPWPVNPRSTARFLRLAKSLSELLSGTSEQQNVVDILICDGLQKATPEPAGAAPAGLAKSLRELVARAKELAEAYRPGERAGPEKDDLVRMARELDEAAAKAALSGDGTPRLIRLAQTVARRLRRIVGTRVRKGACLEAGAGVDASTFSGGRALQRESIEGRLHTVAPAPRVRRRQRRWATMTGADLASSLRQAKALAEAIEKAARKRRTKRAESHWARAVAAGAKPGEGKRFAALVRDIAERGGVRDPEAVAAAIGRRKYGKEAFQRMAAAGRQKA